MCLNIFVLHKDDFRYLKEIPKEWLKKTEFRSAGFQKKYVGTRKRCWSNQVCHFVLPSPFLCAYISQNVMGIWMLSTKFATPLLVPWTSTPILSPQTGFFFSLDWLGYKICSAGPILTKLLNLLPTLENISGNSLINFSGPLPSAGVINSSEWRIWKNVFYTLSAR